MRGDSVHKSFVIVLFILAAIASVAYAATAVKGFPGGDPAKLNAGLTAADRGWHPSDEGGYGESWCLQAQNEAGDLVYVFMSISNYHPLQKHGGTVDLFYYPASGEKFESHAEYKAEETKLATSGVSAEIGGAKLVGSDRRYRYTAKVGDVGMDLTLTGLTPDLRFGGGDIRFGDKGERMWTLTVLAPRATVEGTINVGGKSLPFKGVGYLDHGWCTEKIFEFSKRWYVVRAQAGDMSVNIIDMGFKPGYAPTGTRAIYIAKGGKIVASSANVTLTPAGAVPHPRSGFSLPQSYAIAYDEGGVKLSGTVTMTRLAEGLNVLDRLSPLVRAVIKTFVTDPWQFRFLGETQLSLTADGATTDAKGVVYGEVHHYK